MTDTPTLGEQLDAALARFGISQAELSRRLAAGDPGTKPESKRRWLQKFIGDELGDPEVQSLAEIEAALIEEGFAFTDVERAKAARRVRLAELEAEAGDLKACVLALMKMATALTTQVAALGGAVPQDIQQELARAALRMQPGARPS